MSDANKQDNSKEQILAIGKERVNIRAISGKVNKDIQFLKDRIAKMQAYNNPNRETLKVYEEMLESREAVLQWLESNHQLTEETLSKSA